MAGQEKPHSDTTYPGVIAADELYTLEEAKRRLRWTASALRSAKRRGLRVLVCGKRHYITGKELIRFLEAINTSEG